MVSLAQPSTPAPPARKRRRRPPQQVGVNGMSDLDAWELSDSQICSEYLSYVNICAKTHMITCVDAARAAWKSTVYDHFNMSVVRHTRVVSTDNGVVQVPDHMEYIFTCKSHPETHSIRRRRDDTNRGTGNFHSSISICRKHAASSESSNSATAAAPPYSYAMHLAIIVMSCAYHYLPFARVLDNLFRRQVELLRLGTVVPGSSTISRTTRFVYEQQAHRVKSYFQVRMSHLYIRLNT